MLEQDAGRTNTDDARGVDIGLGLHRHRGIADDTEVLGYEHDSDRDGRGQNAEEGTAAATGQHDRDDDREE